MRKRSAVCWPEKISKTTPILIMHGTADWRVSPLDSLEIAQALQKQNVPYRLIMYEGSDHAITEFRGEVITLAIDWLNKYVKNQHKLLNIKPHGK